MVYATEGVILSTAYYNIIRQAFSYKRISSFFKKSSHLIKGERIKNVISLFMNMLSFIINFTISAVYLYVISTSFSTFFNISNNVVWIVHIFSFFIALILSLISLHKIEPEVFYLFKKKNRLKL